MNKNLAVKFDPIDLLSSMMFADTDKSDWLVSGEGAGRVTSDGVVYEEVDAGCKLAFSVMRPNRAHAFDLVDDDRLVAIGAEYLVRHPAETIGGSAEVVMLCHDRLKWIGLRRLARAPRGIWVANPRSTLYEYHYREAFPSGRNVYNRRVAAVDKVGNPINTVIVGSHGAPHPFGPEGTAVIMAASIIEDAERSGAIQCEITDGNTIVAPIPDGAQKSLFSLRDGPLSGAGRRRAILHHVLGHSRRSMKNKLYDVRDHFRGVTEFVVDGLHVRLSANDRARDRSPQ